MIRRSTGLAVVALILSLLFHFLGITLTFSSSDFQSSPERQAETVALGNSFEEIAELDVEPVEPEPTEPVEPPAPEEQTPPEPPEAEVPTSEALVASPKPQQTFAPDRGLTPPVSPDVNEPETPDRTEAEEPDAPDPSGGDQNEVADARLTPPVEQTPDVVDQPVLSTAPPAEAEVAEPGGVVGPDPETTLAPVPASPQITAPSGDVIAALPAETTPPVLEEVAPPVEPEDETTEEDQQGGAITASVRPPGRPQALTPDTETVFGNTDTPDARQQPPQTLESPLTLYSRDGVDVFAGQRRDSRTPSLTASGGLGPGNAETTNYAGQVLMHLNRTTPVAVSARGWARVTFRINPDGTLASVDVIDGSGSSDIDRAAKTQVRIAEPFPLPPGGRSRMLTFVYRLN